MITKRTPPVGFHGVGIAEQKYGLSLSGEGREIERAQEGVRSPPASGARARGEMDAGGLACAAIGTCLRTFCRHHRQHKHWNRAPPPPPTPHRHHHLCYGHRRPLRPRHLSALSTPALWSPRVYELKVVCTLQASSLMCCCYCCGYFC